jgi:RNA polymerase sigma factor (sigma-70 family)
MHRPSSHPPLDFDALYHTYWDHIRRFCARALGTLPDGTAEEVTQEVFLVAHNALVQQRYRGEGALSTWLCGIARNLCAKARRDAYRHTTSEAIRALEGEVARLERDLVDVERDASPQACAQAQDLRDQLILTRVWLERERERLQEHLRAGAHRAPEASLDTLPPAPDSEGMVRDSIQRLARRDRQAYTVLYLYVLRDAPIDEIAVLQGMSRAAAYRRLAQAKAAFRSVYQTVQR